jgi:hypothetical protein
VIQLPQGPPEIPAPPFDPNLLFLSNSAAPVFVTIVALSLLAATIILWPIMRALGRRLEGRAGDPALRAEVEQLRDRLGEVDHLQQRVAELEERIDFTERMLARAQTPAALPGEPSR